MREVGLERLAMLVALAAIAGAAIVRIILLLFYPTDVGRIVAKRSVRVTRPQAE
jgi:hypothetical protein